MSSIQISQESVEQIKRILRGRVMDLRVVVHEDHVVLLGTSTNYYGKQLAQHCVQKALEISALVNEIEVHRAVPNLNSDSS
jgi:hypothetical protein